MTFLSKRLRTESVENETSASIQEGTRIPRKGHVTASFSAKGGVGKSTFAVNTATALAMHCPGKKVLLWDLDLQFGDIALLLNLNPPESIATLVNNCSSLQWEGIQNYISCNKEGLYVLPAPARPEEAESITLQHITRILEVLKKEFDYIICDTHSSFNDVTIALLDKADAICLLLTLDLPTIKNSKLCVDVMKSLRYDDTKIKLIINHITRFTKIELPDVEGKMKLKTSCNVPYNDEVVISSVDSGRPFVEFAPSSNVSNAVYDICRVIAGEDFSKISDTGLVSKLKGFFGS
jgi:pilus assembly protein CpaE